MDVENISAKDLNSPHEVTVNDGNEEATVTCTPLGYCIIVASDQTGRYPQALKDVANELYYYSMAAAKYFETL